MTETNKGNPFPGLRPFDEEEEDLFFGRERISADLMTRLGSGHFLALIGSSGSGKSSLIRAGFLPSLCRGFMARAGSNWRAVLFNPGDDPIGNLAERLAEPGILTETLKKGPGKGIEQYAASLIESTLRSSRKGISEAFNQARLAKDNNLLIIVDQFEELFRFDKIQKTRSDGCNDSAAFVNLLLECACQTDLPVYIIIVMRSEYLANCTVFPGLPEAINDSFYLVPRMTRVETRSAIEGPVKVRDGKIAPSLLSRLLNDVGDNPDQLPILQHAMMRTWDQWKKDPSKSENINIKHYTAIRTMENALSAHADEVYEELEPKRQQPICAKLFKLLTFRDENGEGIRRPMRLEDIREIIAESIEKVTLKEIIDVIDAFRKESRTFLKPSINKELTAEDVIDISHESLMRIWSRLKGWVKEEGDFADIYGKLVKDAELRKKKKVSLWRGPELMQASDGWHENKPGPRWANLYPPAIDPEDSKEKKKSYDSQESFKLAKEFLEASERKKKRQRLLRLGNVVIIIFAIITLFLLYKAIQNEKEARVNWLTAEALVEFPKDNTKALGIAANAYELGLPNPPGRTSQTLTDIAYSFKKRPYYTTILEDNGKVYNAIFSPDGEKILTSEDGAAKVWNLEGKLLIDSMRHEGRVMSAAYSPDGNQVLTGGWDKIAKLWDKSGKLLHKFEHKRAVTSVAFSPGGKLIITGSWDKTAKLWEINGKLLHQLEHEAAVSSVAFSPDGNFILTLSTMSKEVRMWDLKGEKLLRVPYDEGITSAFFSPRGENIILVFENNTAKSMDLRGKLSTDFPFNNKSISAAVYSPDGSRVLTAMTDGTAKVWDLHGNILHDLDNHGSKVKTAAFSPNGRNVITTSEDDTVRVWNLTNNFLIDLALQDREEQVKAFSADGSLILTAFKDGTIKIWNLEGSCVVNFNSYRERIEEARFLPNNQYIFAAYSDSTAKIWDMKGDIKADFGKIDNLISAVFSPNSQMIVILSRYDVIQLWDIQGKSRLEFTKNPDPLYSAVFSPNSDSILIGSKNGQVKLWDLRGSVLLGLSHQNDIYISSVDFSPDGKRFLSASRDQTVKLWDLDGNLLYLIKHETALKSAIFSPDGSKILTVTSDGTAKLWGIEGYPPVDLNANGDDVISTKFSSKGDRILTASRDGTVKLWDSEGNLLANLNRYMNSIGLIGFSFDNRRILAASKNGSVKIWYTPDAIYRWLSDRGKLPEWSEFFSR